MVQVRCPECGYLQTLSEERFLTISEDFLNCPHCHARVPKHWSPSESETIPEEQRHKILAFSRRILNGGDVGPEMVLALEALVRRYGPTEESDKALGIGYTGLGEWRKAEEFLIQAHKKTPEDADVLRSLQEALLGQDKCLQATAVGRRIMDLLGQRVNDDDVARTVLSLIGSERIYEAEELLESYPNLDHRNPLVKQARKELSRVTGGRLAALLKGAGPLQRFLSSGGRDGIKSLTRKARDLMGSVSVEPRRAGTSVKRGVQPADVGEKGTQRPNPSHLPVVMEYWIYAPEAVIPGWDEVRSNLAEQFPGNEERERTFKILDSLIEGNLLSIDYILRKDAEELFHYPEDLFLRNARDLSEEDRRTVLEARMIVRMRLAVRDDTGRGPLSFMTRFVESVRKLTGGVVQDAISHTLWGAEQWRLSVEKPSENMAESQIRFEVLDEGDSVWIHTHGMQKFGLPDLEMENLSAEDAPGALRLVVLTGKLLLAAKDRRHAVASGLAIPGTPVRIALEARPPDPESHFPAGTLVVVPRIIGGEAEDTATVDKVMSALSSASASKPGREAVSEPSRTACENDGKTALAREKLLDAHRKAKTDLPLFRQSFRQIRNAEGHVHAVKVGFRAQGGDYEWMWVSLDVWQGETLEGRIQNSPILRKDLQKGSKVNISEREIFDWVIVRSGDILKGAYTEGITA